MNYTTLGRTGVKVSRLCLGTMNFGAHTSPEDSFAIMDKALESGVQFFDSADVYGGKQYEGYTEQIVGRWLAQGHRRDRIVLATKVFGTMGPGLNDRGVSAYHVKRACEASLKRLQTDCIDLYQMHHVDRAVPWEEVWQALEQLVREGKILYCGSSNFAGWHIATACQTAARRNFLGLVCEQSKYNLTNRMVELEVLPACRFHGVGVIPWSPLEGGALGGTEYSSEKSRRASESVQRRREILRPQLEQFDALCKELGEAPANVALAWLLANPAVTAPIIGPRTLEQLTGALRAVEITLSPETMKKLDAIFPGPGNTAPEAYAW